ERTLQHHRRRNPEPILDSYRETALIEFRRRLRRTEGVHREVLHLTREPDDEPAEPMAGREHRVQPGERVEADQPDVRLTGQAFDRFFDVAVLHVLRDEQPILLERTANGESRL